MKRIIIAAIAVIGLLVGCGPAKDTALKKDVTAEDAKRSLEKAETDILEAQKAGADEMAKDLMVLARDHFKFAQEFMKNSDYPLTVEKASKSSEYSSRAKQEALTLVMIDKAEKAINEAGLKDTKKLFKEKLEGAKSKLVSAKAYYKDKQNERAYADAKQAYEDAMEVIRTYELEAKLADTIKEAEGLIKEAKGRGAAKHAAELLASAEKNLAEAKARQKDADIIKGVEFAQKAVDDAKAALSACEAANAKKYIVKSGDCLWRISNNKATFGDPFLWPLIYKLNAGQIKDPELIYPAQEFLVPTDPSKVQLDKAREDATQYREEKRKK